tara:strand:- start:34 stop:855 length:822 start_codon:yes stop_codon:yes gene_type:complete
MTTFAIGDVQGCHKSFQALLKAIDFHSNQDHLVFVGDLVNRGLGSLPLAEWILDNRDSVSAVLGNHDVHLLAVIDGVQSLNPRDTLEDLLGASCCIEFRDWLLEQCFYRELGGWSVAHAGVFPQWASWSVQEQSDTLMEILRSAKRVNFLSSYRQDSPTRWSEALSASERARFSLSAFTRMRTFTLDGALDFSFTGSLDQLPASLVPWFRLQEATRHKPIVFGHWAALGNHTENSCYGIDSGCVWGGSLTALNLDTGERVSVGALAADLIDSL